MMQPPTGDQSTQGRTSRLFRQDRQIVWNTVRATFAGWHDRVVAALLLLGALAWVHNCFADRPWTVAVLVAVAVGVLIGLGVGRLVTARLAFHAFDGLLAADALLLQTRRRYMVAWHGVAMLLLILVTLVARPALLIASFPAYLAGVLLAGLASDAGMPRWLAGRGRPGRTIQGWARRPIAGVSAATVLLVTLLFARTLGADAQIVVIGIVALSLALLLTGVDDATVRFMAVAGHGSRRIVGHHANALAFFVAVAVPGCWIAAGPFGAGIVAAAGLAVATLLALRILAYRLHAKRFADLVVSIIAGVLLLVAYLFPPGLPVIALAVLWHLHRRGCAATWLLA